MRLLRKAFSQIFVVIWKNFCGFSIFSKKPLDETRFMCYIKVYLYGEVLFFCARFLRRAEKNQYC